VAEKESGGDQEARQNKTRYNDENVKGDTVLPLSALRHHTAANPDIERNVVRPPGPDNGRFGKRQTQTVKIGKIHRFPTLDRGRPCYVRHNERVQGTVKQRSVQRNLWRILPSGE
jgi:hypothetical protein